MVTHEQLLELRLTRDGIKHRVRKGRLHRVHLGVYAVGRAELTRRGRWLAAVLSLGDGAVLGHVSAAALWGIEDREREIEVTIPWPRQSRRQDVRVRCLKLDPRDRSQRDRIPVTSPARTLIDLATVADVRRLEAAVNATDKLELIGPEQLRAEVAERAGQPGVPALRRLLDRESFRLTDSELERRFLRVVRRAGLPMPETGVWLNGFKVDFLWRELGLIVETDGLRYHRTAAQQSRDLARDNRHTAAGFTTLRFSHAQVTGEPEAVAATLARTLRRREVEIGPPRPGR